MSDNRSIKIKPAVFWKISVFLILTIIVIGNIKFIVDNLIHSQEVDQEIISEANPRLNRQQLKQATDVLDSFKNQDLTSIFPSARVENEATVPGIERIINLSVQNASGIAGAAAKVAELINQQGYQINEISTAPALRKITTVSYQAGLAAEAQAIEKLLKDDGWPLGQSQEAIQQTYDIAIILGK